jgi:hypothetical protein
MSDGVLRQRISAALYGASIDDAGAITDPVISGRLDALTDSVMAAFEQYAIVWETTEERGEGQAIRLTVREVPGD